MKRANMLGKELVADASLVRTASVSDFLFKLKN